MTAASYIGPDDHWKRLDAWNQADLRDQNARFRGHDFTLPQPAPLPDRPADTHLDFAAFAEETHRLNEERQEYLRELFRKSQIRPAQE